MWLIDVRRKDGTVVAKNEDLLKLQEEGDLVIFSSHAHSKNPSWAGRTVIHSTAAMTYQQAHNLIHGKPPGPLIAPRTPHEAGQFIDKSLWKDLAADLKILTAISRCLLDQRHRSGSIDLSAGGGNELKFKLDPEGLPAEAAEKEELEEHSTIAELMILANSSVCSLIRQHAPLNTLMRIHPPPSREKLSNLKEFSSNIGMKELFDKGEKDTTQGTASRISHEMLKSARKDRNVVKLMTSALIKSMNEAKYVSSSQLTGSLVKGAQSSQMLLQGHSGLGIDDYTHFTSPIRRYADIIVHRELLSLIPLPTNGVPELYNNTSRPAVVSPISSLLPSSLSQPPPSVKIEQVHTAPTPLDMDEELGS